MPSAFHVYFFSLVEGPSKVRRRILGKRFEDRRSFGTGLQQVEIAAQSGGIFTFDPHWQRGQLLGAICWNWAARSCASRDDRRHRSLVPSDEALARCRLRSFPRIKHDGPGRLRIVFVGVNYVQRA